MGFQMSAWDMKLLKYGKLFEDKMMSLKVNIPARESARPGLGDTARLFLS